MSKYNRHQSVISRNCDSASNEHDWLSALDKNLQKEAVQPKSVDQSLFHQINNIMNGKSKYPTVDMAVEDMKNRSGLTAYLSKINKVSEEEPEVKQKKIAADQQISTPKDLTPDVIKKYPQIKTTLENYIRDTKGNLPIPAIIEKIKSIHQRDASDAKDWDDEKLIRLVSQMNLKAKQDNPANFQHYNNLGTHDSMSDSEIDPSNTDAFFALQPSKF